MICKAPVKAVSFDVDGTLVHHLGPAETIARFLESKGIRPNADSIERAILSVDVPREGFSDPEEYYLALNREILLRLGAYSEGWEKELLDYWFSPENYSEAPGARRALEVLSRAGLTLVIVSNNLLREVRAVLGRLGLLGYFHAIFTPEVVGAFKPSPQVFVRVAELLRLEPSQILHVGDKVDEDYVAAVRAGAQAVVISREPLPVPYVRELSELASKVIDCIG